MLISLENVKKLIELKEKHKKNVFLYIDILALISYFEEDFTLFDPKKLNYLEKNILSKDSTNIKIYIDILNDINPTLKNKKISIYQEVLHDKMTSLIYKNYKIDIELLQNLIKDFNKIKLKKIRKHTKVTEVFIDKIDTIDLLTLFKKSKKYSVDFIKSNDDLIQKLNDLFLKERDKHKINLIFESNDDKQKFIEYFKIKYKFNYVDSMTRDCLKNLYLIKSIILYKNKHDEKYLKEINLLTFLSEKEIDNRILSINLSFNVDSIINVFSIRNSLNFYEKEIINLLNKEEINISDIPAYLDFFTNFMFYYFNDNNSIYNVYSIDEISINFLEAINIIVASKEELNFKDYISMRLKINFNKYILYKLLKEALFNYFLVYDLKTKNQIDKYYHSFSFLIDLLMLLK